MEEPQRIWQQTDQPTIGPLRAIKVARRQGQLLVAAFDGIPDFVDLLKSGEVVASGLRPALALVVMANLRQCIASDMLVELAGVEPQKVGSQSLQRFDVFPGDMRAFALLEPKNEEPTACSVRRKQAAREGAGLVVKPAPSPLA